MNHSEYREQLKRAVFIYFDRESGELKAIDKKSPELDKHRETFVHFQTFEK